MGAYGEQKKEVDDALHALKLGKESLTILHYKKNAISHVATVATWPISNV